MARYSEIKLDKYPTLEHNKDDCFICNGQTWDPETCQWIDDPRAKKHGRIKQQREGGA